MAARVIQGFFIGGQAHPAPGIACAAPVQRKPLAAARMLAGPPPPAHAGRGAPLQRFGTGNGFEVDAARLGLARSGGRQLPGALLAKMEAAFGADFSAVRVHVGPQAARIGALAFTTGNDVYFAPGRYHPESVQGQQLIGHELAHVVQQRQGRVRAPAGGLAVIQDRALEAEADRLGMRAALHRAPVQAKRAFTAPAGLRSGPVQRPIQRASALAKPVASTSGLNDTNQNCSGQIYGIWKNEEYPGKIKESSLKAEKCLYIGKTSPADGYVGGRFITHVREDHDCPWSLKQGCDYDEHDDMVWPYVVREIWKYNGITKFDVQVAEQHYQQSYAKEKPPWNKIAALTLDKFNELKDIPGVWTTKKGYASTWKPVK